jgi:natural product precursor
MRRLKKLELVQLEGKELSQVGMKNVKGGWPCSCGCCYQGSGGSSTANNADANGDSNKYSYNC